MIIQYRTRLTDLLSRRPTGRRVFYWQQTPRSSLRFFLAHNFLTNSYPNSSHPFSFRLPHSFAPRLLACPPVPTALCCLPTPPHPSRHAIAPTLLFYFYLPKFPPLHPARPFVPCQLFHMRSFCRFFAGKRVGCVARHFFAGSFFFRRIFFAPLRVRSIGQCVRFASTQLANALVSRPLDWSMRSVSRPVD